MKQTLTALILFLALFPSMAFSQDSQYPFTYKPKFQDRPGFVYMLMDESNVSLSDTATRLLSFRIMDEEAYPVSFASFYIISSTGDTLKLKSELEGKAFTRMPYESFYIVVNHPFFSDLNQYIPLSSDHRTKELSVVLGKSFRTVIPTLRSKRALTDKEIIGIIRECSNGNQRPKLIREKTCYLSFEI